MVWYIFFIAFWLTLWGGEECLENIYVVRVRDVAAVDIRAFVCVCEFMNLIT